MDPIERLAWYLDNAFRVPGTRYRFGWDGILGLIPGLGEAVTMLMQAGIVLWAVARYEVPGVLAVRMVLNIAIDSTVGSIPLIGDVFDFFFKANTKNVALLREYRVQKLHGGPMSSWRHFAFIALVFVALLALAIACAALTILVVLWLYEQWLRVFS
ncbi:DUF4112 domain-containing protein [bacterium]|nr:DUF4112 domain-containing protein [bacterium]